MIIYIKNYQTSSFKPTQSSKLPIDSKIDNLVLLGFSVSDFISRIISRQNICF